MNRKIKLFSSIIVIIICICMSACGAGDKELEGEKKIVLTTGLEENELFVVGDGNCNLSEALIYYATMKSQYEGIFGNDFWSKSDQTLELKDNLKEVALARIVQIKVMNQMAVEYNIELDEHEKMIIEEISSIFYGELSKNDIDSLGIAIEDIRKMYSEYTIANKLHKHMIAEVNPEISDDEAREITINRMIFKTDKVSDSDAVKAAQMLKVNEEFNVVASNYKGVDVKQSTFCKGENVVSENVEEIAFELSQGESSNVIRTDEGWEVIQCVEPMNREETEANKVRIVEERCKGAFSKQYEVYVDKLVMFFNFEMWDDAIINFDNNMSTINFFGIYEEKFNL